MLNDSINRNSLYEVAKHYAYLKINSARLMRENGIEWFRYEMTNTWECLRTLVDE